jgi:CheY-like chemotaxis protein
MAQLSKILVVEDNPILLLDICEQLEDLGYSTVTATTVATAARLLDKRITALITDIELGPGPDGLALARLAARNFPGLPIVVMSGGVVPGVNDLPPGARFMPKPYRLETIVNVLERHNRAHAA